MSTVQRAANPFQANSGSHSPGKRTGESYALGGLIQRAQELYSAGNYLGALEICENVYELEACRTDNLLLLSAANFQLRKFSESVFYCQQAVRVNPSCAEAYSNMGNVFRELGDIDAAIQFYLQAVKLKPRFADAYNNLASCYFNQSLLEDAIDTFQMAILLDPSLIDAHCNLGTLFRSQASAPDLKSCLPSYRIYLNRAILKLQSGVSLRPFDSSQISRLRGTISQACSRRREILTRLLLTTRRQSI